MAPTKIGFEITETAAIGNLTRANQLIAELRRLGCAFSLDDFGSGVSSFAYLKALTVDWLKIDGLFVGNIVHDRVDYEMVRSITDIGHVMGKKVVAESVESAAVLERLKQIGVDYAQGLALGAPGPDGGDREGCRPITPTPPADPWHLSARPAASRLRRPSRRGRHAPTSPSSSLRSSAARRRASRDRLD